MNIDQSIQRHEISALTLPWNFIWRSSLWGCGTGAVLGFLYAYSAIALLSLDQLFSPNSHFNLFTWTIAILQSGIFAASIGIIIGALLGLLLGLANGLIIGILILRLSTVRPDIQQFLEVMRFLSVIITIIGSSIGLYLTIIQQIDSVFIFLILPVVIAGWSAWWVSGKMTQWYVRATQLKLWHEV